MMLLLFFASVLPLVFATTNTQTCKEIWVDNKLKENVSFYLYDNSTSENEVHIENWKWTTGLNEKWSLYYKEWPKKGVSSGGFQLLNGKKTLAKLSWKANNGSLLWTTKFRKPFTASWNGTVCKPNVPVRLQTTKGGWLFHLGELVITGGKSGKKLLNGMNHPMQADEGSPWRKKREVEDMEGNGDKDGKDKETTWKKIKGWFKELFDQSYSKAINTSTMQDRNEFSGIPEDVLKKAKEALDELIF